MNKSNTISKYITIKSFKFINNQLILNTCNEDENEYIIYIKNGSIDALIKSCQGDEVGLKYLDEGDVVKIKGVNIENNKINIRKIYIKTKYIFNSESSDDLDYY
jgi:pyruvate kinase